MNMKQLSAMIVLFVAVGTAMAVIISPFTGWDDLTRKSPDIVIARCATTPNPTGIGDGDDFVGCLAIPPPAICADRQRFSFTLPTMATKRFRASF